MSIKKGIEIIKRYQKQAPIDAGVYRMLDIEENPLYIGKAKNIAKRIIAYTMPEKLPHRLQMMVANTAKMEFITTKNEVEALLLEASMVRSLQPKYNILLKDDKSFPYILINNEHDFPRILKHRGSRSIKGEYFGPFASIKDVNETITSLQKIFLIRPCSDNYFAARKRPCLQYQIKRCSAPCVQKISKPDYMALINHAVNFLKGKDRSLQDDLAEEMSIASEKMEYEKAAAIRDRIKSLTTVQSRSSVPSIQDADIIALWKEGGLCAIQIFFIRGNQNYGNKAYFPTHISDANNEEIIDAFIGQFYQSNHPPKEILLSHFPGDITILEHALSIYGGKVKISVPQKGEKIEFVKLAIENAKDALRRKITETENRKNILKDIAELFEIEKDVKHIEIYDNSHIMGKNAVGAMVVAGIDGFIKSGYRKFNIRTTLLGDDYAMMKEVFTRRFSKNELEIPDLVLIDGGEGQLLVATKVLEELGINIKCVAIAKGVDRNAGKERFFIPGKNPFSLDINDPKLYFLQNLRDEAHRYAIGAHRLRRAKQFTLSSLDNIKGIGIKRKNSLLRYFGSVQAVSKANIEELTKAEFINEKTAKLIIDHFRRC